MGKQNRDGREAQTRDTKSRKKAWVRPETLPEIEVEDGYAVRWVRVAMRGQADPTNVSSKLREGWEPIRAEDHPNVFCDSDVNPRFKDNLIVGGLMACKAPQEMVDARREHFQNMSEGQMRTVDNNLMRESDARMPLENTSRSEVVFGDGN